MLDELERKLNRVSREDEKKYNLLQNAINKKEQIESRIAEAESEYLALSSPTTEQTTKYSANRTALDEQLSKSGFDVEKARISFNQQLEGGRTAAVNAAKRSMQASFRSGAVQSEIAQSASGSGAFHKAFQNTKSYAELERRQQRGYKAIEAMEGIALTQDLTDPRGKSMAARMMKAKQVRTAMMGEDQAAMDLMRQQGRDPMSLYKSSEKTLGKIEDYQAARGMTQQIAAGQHGSLAQETNKLDQLAKDAQAAFSALNKAAASGADNLEDLRVAAGKAGEAFDTQSDKVKEMGRQGAGGGWGGRIAGAGRMIGDVGRIGMAVAGIQRYGEVTSNLERGQNRIGMAQFQNQRFDEAVAAASGDYGALRRITGGTYEAAMLRGTGMGEAEQSARRKEMYGYGAQTAASGLGTLANMAPGLGQARMAAKVAGGSGKAGLLGNIAGSIVSGTADAATSGQMAYEAYVDIQKRNSQTRVALQAANQAVQLDTTQNYIGDKLMNEFGKAQDAAWQMRRGAGSGRFEQLERGLLAGGDNFVDLMNRAHIAPGGGKIDYFKLAGQGFKGLGTDFTAGDIASAATVEKNRQMEAQEFLSARARLSDVGDTGGKAMADVLAKAVETGMDNSKNIMQMVSATTALSSASAQMGVNNVQAAAGALGAGVQAGVNAGMSRNIAARAAQKSQSVRDSAARDVGMNLANVMEMHELTTSFKGATVDEKATMAALSATQLEGLTVKTARQYGLGGIVKSQADVDRLKKIGLKQQLHSIMKTFNNPAALRAGLNAIEAGKPLPEITENAIKRAGVQAQDQFSGVTQIGQINRAITNRNPAPTNTPPPGGIDVKTGKPAINGNTNPAVPDSGSPGGQSNKTVPSTGGTGYGAQNHLDRGSSDCYPADIKNMNELMANTESYLGAAYGKNGGLNNRDSIDCSGLAQKQLVAGGLLDPKYATRRGRTNVAGLHEKLKSGEIAATKLEAGAKPQKGDLILVNTPHRGGKFDHIEMGLGNNKMIGSSSGRGVQIRDAEWYQKQGHEVEIWRPQYNFKKAGGTDVQIAAGKASTASRLARRVQQAAGVGVQVANSGQREAGEHPMDSAAGQAGIGEVLAGPNTDSNVYSGSSAPPVESGIKQRVGKDRIRAFIDPAKHSDVRAQAQATTQTAKVTAGIEEIEKTFGSVENAGQQMLKASGDLKGIMSDLKEAAQATSTSLEFPKDFKQNMDQLNEIVKGLTTGAQRLKNRLEQQDNSGRDID
jgi:hypothetical protein